MVKYLFLGVCVWYVVLISGHFYNQRPLWNDEVCVLNNITQLSSYDLFHSSLISDQAFPRIYLWMIQQLYNITGHQVWSLRLLPWLCMLGAFIIWMRIGCMSWKNNFDRLNYALCWSASIPLIYYAAELKQYSMDVLAGSILVILLLRGASWGCCLFPLLGLFSYPVFFLMLVPTIILWPRKKIFFVYLSMCALMVSYVWYFDVRISATHLLETYWHEYFISFASVSEFFRTLGEGLNNLISRWFVEDPKIFRGISRFFVGVGFIYMLWHGVISLKQHKLNVSVIALLIFMEMLVLGALRKLPFTVPRMSLFFAPMLLFVMVTAFVFLRERLPKLYWPIQFFMWFYLIIMSIGISQAIFSGDLGAQTKLFS